MFRYGYWNNYVNAIAFQSPFSGDFLCFAIIDHYPLPFPVRLSISIFRRLSLFRNTIFTIFTNAMEVLSISIFRRLSLFHPLPARVGIVPVRVFQSPFSGDFLCFIGEPGAGKTHTCVFQSPFSGDFLCFFIPSDLSQLNHRSFNLHFQETFFVSCLRERFCAGGGSIAFNLHFQETFFVSPP